jgi:hypothetical protein
MPVIGALAAIDVVFLALMGVGLLYITRQIWVPFLIWLLSQIPVIGGWVASQTGHWVNAAFSWVGQRVAQLIQPLTDAISRVIVWVRGYVQGVAFDINALIDALHHIRFDVLGELSTRLIVFIASRLAALSSALMAQIVALARELELVRAAAIAYAEARFGDAINAAQQLNGRLRDWVVALIASTLAYLEQRFAQQLQQTETRVRQAEAAAAGEVAQAERLASAQLADLKAYVDGSIVGVVGLEQTLAWDARKYADLLNARTLATSLAAAGTVAIGLEAIRELECIKLCAPLSLVGNAIEALDLAALVLLVAEAAHDPKGTAGFLQATIAPVIDEGVTLARGVAQL